MEIKLRHYCVVVAAMLILAAAGTVLLLMHAHKHAVRLAMKQFSEKQSLLARQTAIGIEENIRSVVRELDLLTADPAVRSMDVRKLPGILKEGSKWVSRLYVNDIGVLDSKGILQANVGAPQLVGSDFSYRQYFLDLRASRTNAPVFEFITFKGVDAGDEGLIVALPILSRDHEFAGVVLYTLKISELVEAFLPPQTPEGRSWAIAEEGYLLYHPTYRAGVVIDELPSAPLAFKAFVGEMKAGRSCEAEYVSPEGVKTIAASCPVKIEGHDVWSVVVAAPERVVSGLLVQLRRRNVLGTSLAVAAVLLGALFLVHVLRKWNVGLEQEIAQRRHVEKQLEQHRLHLEEMVEQRTAELRSANERLQMEATERQRAEQELFKESRLLKDTLESISDPFYVVDAKDYTVKMANSACNFGPLTERSICHTLTHGSERPCEGAESPCTITEIKKTKKPVVLEHVHRDPDGSEKTIEVHGYPIFDAHGDVAQVIEYARDITEQKRLQKRLRHAEKMESMGMLAGCVAHDLNNILQPIMAYPDMIMERLPPNDVSTKDLREIQDAATRASAIIQDLLAMGRRHDQDTRADVNDVIRAYLNTASFNDLRKRHPGVEIICELQNELPLACASSSRLSQALMNLIINAFECMAEDGGICRVETQYRIVDETRDGYVTIDKGEYIIASVSDTGHGIDAADLNRIFEPFFTKKEMGRSGSGLGLAVVWNVTRDAGGYVDVHSELGRGTRFDLYLRVAPDIADVQPRQREFDRIV